MGISRMAESNTDTALYGKGYTPSRARVGQVANRRRAIPHPAYLVGAIPARSIGAAAGSHTDSDVVGWNRHGVLRSRPR